MTKKEMFEMIKEMCSENEDVVNFCEHEIELEEKRKASAEKRKANKAKENAELEDAIFNVISEVGQVVTCKEVANELGISPQKATPRLTALVNSGRIKRSSQGKNIYFSIE